MAVEAEDVLYSMLAHYSYVDGISCRQIRVADDDVPSAFDICGPAPILFSELCSRDGCTTVPPRALVVQASRLHIPPFIEEKCV